MEFVEILKVIATACGALVTIITFLTLVFSKPKKWLKDTIKTAIQEEHREIKQEMYKLKEEIRINKEASQAALRYEITEIYDAYGDKECLPSQVKKDLINLYTAYKNCGGNGSVSQLVEILLNKK